MFLLLFLLVKKLFLFKKPISSQKPWRKVFPLQNVSSQNNVIYHFQKWNVLAWFLCQTCGEIHRHNGGAQQNRHDFNCVAQRNTEMETESELELFQGDFYSFGQEKVPFLSIYLPTLKKCSHQENHACLNPVYSICHRMNTSRLVKRPTFPLC